MTSNDMTSAQAAQSAANSLNIAGVSMDTKSEEIAPVAAEAPFQPSMEHVTVIAQLSCEGCRAVQAMLDEIGLAYETVYLDEYPELANRYELEKVPALLIPDPASGTIRIIRQSEAVYQFICQIRQTQAPVPPAAPQPSMMHLSVYVTYQGKIGDAPKMVAALINADTQKQLPSPSILRGKGTAFSEAILDLTQQLTDYINTLTLYRDQVLKTTLVYQQAILEPIGTTERSDFNAGTKEAD